jgi:hypothetical protein
MVHSLQCRATAAAWLKNDKAGTATLAHLLRADLLPVAWTAPPEVRQCGVPGGLSLFAPGSWEALDAR